MALAEARFTWHATAVERAPEGPGDGPDAAPAPAEPHLIASPSAAVLLAAMLREDQCVALTPARGTGRQELVAGTV